jgi:chromosomal replication initiator protein
MTKASFPEIGTKFGGKDHSTVIHAFRQVEKKISADRDLKNVLDSLLNELQK